MKQLTMLTENLVTNKIMNKKTLLIVLLLLNNILNAQIIRSMTTYNSQNLKAGDYYKDVDGLLNKFTGTWKYISGNEEFVVKILKVNGYNFAGSNDYSEDILFGGYKYVKNNATIIDKLNFTYNNLNDYQNFAPFMGGSGQFSNNFQSISLLGDDLVVGKWLYIDLEVIPNTNPVQMRWKTSPRENIRLNNTLPSQGAGNGIPKDIILIKQ